ncbi:MAG TPA: hypothetical protein VGM56_14690 [Byssovorax sp.]
MVQAWPCVIPSSRGAACAACARSAAARDACGSADGAPTPVELARPPPVALALTLDAVDAVELVAEWLDDEDASPPPEASPAPALAVDAASDPPHAPRDRIVAEASRTRRAARFALYSRAP